MCRSDGGSLDPAKPNKPTSQTDNVRFPLFWNVLYVVGGFEILFLSDAFGPKWFYFVQTLDEIKWSKFDTFFFFSALGIVDIQLKIKLKLKFNTPWSKFNALFFQRNLSENDWFTIQYDTIHPDLYIINLCWTIYTSNISRLASS